MAWPARAGWEAKGGMDVDASVFVMRDVDGDGTLVRASGAHA